MKHIYLIFTQTGTSASRMFKVFTKMPYNHASISFDRELTEMYSFGRRVLYFQFLAGLIQEDPDTHVYKRFPDTTCRIIALPVTDEQYARAKQEVNLFWVEVDKYKYDILGVPARAAGVKWKRDYRFVCSEFVGLVLSRAGILHYSEAECYFLKPSDLYNIPGSETIYIGTLKGYNRGNFYSNLRTAYNL